jgi:hypothetical protein
MPTTQPGDQVVELAPDGERVEVHTVVKVLPDGVQVSGASGKIAKASLRWYEEDVVKRIKQKEDALKNLKHEIKSLYESLRSLS